MDATAQLNERVSQELRHGTLDTAKLGEYIRAGFDVNAALNSWGLSALHVAATWTNPANPACIAALVAAGANVNATSENGQTPLYSAAKTRNVECIVVLLAADADPNLATFRSRRTPLHAAAARGDVRCVAALLAAGANTEAVRTAPVGWDS